MKDYIKEIEGRYYERLMYYPQDCDSSWVIDIKNLLALVKAYEEYVWMYADLNDQNADELKDKIKKQIFEKEVGK